MATDPQVIQLSKYVASSTIVIGSPPSGQGNLPIPVPIIYGGTGAANPTQARANLGITGGGGQDDSSAPLQSSAFELTDEFSFWPVSMTNPFAVTLPTNFANDGEYIIKDVEGNASTVNALISAGASIDNQSGAMLINVPRAWVRLYWSVTLATWSIVG